VGTDARLELLRGCVEILLVPMGEVMMMECSFVESYVKQNPSGSQRLIPSIKSGNENKSRAIRRRSP